MLFLDFGELGRKGAFLARGNGSEKGTMRERRTKGRVEADIKSSKIMKRETKEGICSLLVSGARVGGQAGRGRGGN